LRVVAHHVAGCNLPHGDRAAAGVDCRYRERAVPIRRNVAADRGWRRAGHDGPDAAASAAPEVRRLHEEGTRALPRSPSDWWILNCSGIGNGELGIEG